MNAVLAIPLPARLVALFAAGLAVGAAINAAVYLLAFRPLGWNPWSHEAGPPDARDWRRRLPVVGWWFARTQREAREHGFWLRAALVEIVTGLLFAWLYLIEVEHDLPRWLMAPAMLPPAALLSENVPLVLHLRYTGHLLLVSLMLVASLIDYDEQLIPDALTVCGTLAALVLATVYPWSLLPAGDWLVNGRGPWSSSRWLRRCSGRRRSAAGRRRGGWKWRWAVGRCGMSPCCRGIGT